MYYLFLHTVAEGWLAEAVNDEGKMVNLILKPTAAEAESNMLIESGRPYSVQYLGPVMED